VAEALRPEDILDFEMISDAQLSPDGSQVAFVRIKMDRVANEQKAATASGRATSIWSTSVAASPGGWPACPEGSKTSAGARAPTQWPYWDVPITQKTRTAILRRTRRRRGSAIRSGSGT
jgi:hypothetical protein